MRAVTCTGGELAVGEFPDPVPDEGQLLLSVTRSGICGSDLHARHHTDELAALTAEAGYDGIARSDQPVVFGHEFCGEVVDRGRGARRLRPGTRVVAMPLLRSGGAVHAPGLSPHAPGAYAEQVLVEQSVAFAVPDGLPTDLATLTEPMAVGLHAVRRSEIRSRQVAVVIGCGPVGLAVVGMLKASGVRTVVAADLSAARRALATTVGADVVVDPREQSPYEVADHGHVHRASEVFDLAVDAVSRLRSLPFVPWERVWQAAEFVGATTSEHPVVFECVGVPGMLDAVIAGAPLYSRVVVVGVCMQPDRIRPAMAINKEIDLRFVLGYTPKEFRDALHLLADGKLAVESIVTGTVGLEGVGAAFDVLADAGRHAKILVDPASAAVTPA